MIAFPFDRARDVLKSFRDRTASLPDEHTLFAGLTHAPDGSGTKLAVLVTCHCGPLDAAKGGAALKTSGLRPWMRSARCLTANSIACSTPPIPKGLLTIGNRASCGIER